MADAARARVAETAGPTEQLADFISNVGRAGVPDAVRARRRSRGSALGLAAGYFRMRQYRGGVTNARRAAAEGMTKVDTLSEEPGWRRSADQTLSGRRLPKTAVFRHRPHQNENGLMAATR
jgi:hypothetical protein